MPRCARCQEEFPEAFRYCPTDGIPLGVTEAGDLVGQTVDGRYRVTAMLGYGGMGIVYLAHHEVLDRGVALKVLPPDRTADPRSVARLVREARLASRINHENVVGILDFAHASDGFYYIVMEHVNGVTLRAELETRGRIAPGRAVHIMAQVAAGLADGHGAGMVHRDIKPENIMLCRHRGDSSFVKVLDFGLARLATEPALTRSGGIMGTLDYISPEQARGGQADARSDVYSMGMVLFELLTGEVPFSGSTMQVLEQHKGTPPPAPSTLCPEGQIPPELDALVLRAVEKDPARRFEDASQLLVALCTVPALGGAFHETTYAEQRRAAPPDENTLPDPTHYEAASMDATWDGPRLCAELSHLRRLRQRRLEEISSALWGGSPPPLITELRNPIDALEDELHGLGRRIEELHQDLREAEMEAREEEASLRAACLEATLAAGAAAERIPAQALPEVPNMSVAEAEHARSTAQRRLEHHMLRSKQESLALAEKIREAMTLFKARELELAPLYEEVSRAVQAAATKRKKLRPLVVAFGQVDGAIAAFHALLETATI